MKVTFIGGAAAIIENEGKRILFDPWLDDRIFHGSWEHFPPLRFSANDLPPIDYLFISHIHEDHCALETLRLINKDCEVILLDRKPNFVLDFLKRNQLGFKKIHLVPPHAPMKIANDLWVDLLHADPQHHLSYNVDSSIVLKWGDKIIYNANDCGFFPALGDYLLTTYGQIDVAFLPYAAGSSFPPCYVNMTPEEKIHAKDRIFNAAMGDFINSVKTLNPKRVIPFADGYCIAGSRSHLNNQLSHPPGSGCLVDIMKREGLSEKLVLLNSNQSYDVDTETKSPDEAYISYTDKDRDDYIQTITDLPKYIYDHEKVIYSSSVATDRLLQHARKRLWIQQESKNYFPNFRYYIFSNDPRRKFVIDLQKEGVLEVDADAKIAEPYLGLIVSNTLLIQLLIGHVSWNIADAALFIDYERVPNVYDPEIYTFINFIKI